MPRKEDILLNVDEYSVDQLVTYVKEGIVSFQELCDETDGEFSAAKRREVKHKLESGDSDEWNKVQVERTIEAVERYLNAYPDGQFRSQARALKKEIEDSLRVGELNEAVKSAWKLVDKRSVDALSEFVSKYPDSPYAEEANKLINDLLIDDILDISADTLVDQIKKIQTNSKLTVEQKDNNIIAQIKDYITTKKISKKDFLDKLSDDHNLLSAGVVKRLIESGIIETLGFERVSALMTTSVEGLNYPIEIVAEYVKLGFCDVFIRALNPYGLATENDDWEKYTERFIEFYKKALNHIIDLNLSGTFFREDYAAIILKKMITSFNSGFVDLQSPAGVVNSVIVYNYDGFVYASDESRMLAEMGDYTFRLGSVDDDYEQIEYGAKVREMAKVWSNETLAGCSDCALKVYCGADPVRNYSTQGDMYGYRPNSLLCKKNKAIIEYIIELIITRGDKVLPVFKSWFL